MQVLDSPNREAVVPVVVVRGINTTRIEVQVVAVSRRVQRSRPVVAARAGVAEVRVAAAAGGRKKNTPISIRALARDKPPIDAIPGRPCGGAIVDEG